MPEAPVPPLKRTTFTRLSFARMAASSGVARWRTTRRTLPRFLTLKRNEYLPRPERVRRRAVVFVATTLPRRSMSSWMAWLGANAVDLPWTRTVPPRP
jgi:hypothetical protein